MLVKAILWIVGFYNSCQKVQKWAKSTEINIFIIISNVLEKNFFSIVCIDIIAIRS